MSHADQCPNCDPDPAGGVPCCALCCAYTACDCEPTRVLELGGSVIDRITGAIGDAAAWLYTQLMKIPHPVRLVIRDSLEGAAVALTTLTIVVPQNAEEARDLAITLSVAVGAAVLAVLRRRIWSAVLDRIGEAPGE